MLSKVPVSAIVLTFNEEHNIRRCMDSLAQSAGEIIVVDSFSTDRTLDIVREYTNTIYQHAYEGHPQQWQWTLDNVSATYEWIFAIDSDFAVTSSLWKAIGCALATNRPNIAGYFVRHRQIFRGRFIRHGTIYPRYWLRLFRRSSVYIDRHDLVDIHFYVNGSADKLEYDVIEDNYKDRSMAFWVAKQARFAQRQATEEVRRRLVGHPSTITPRFFGNPDQRILWYKEFGYHLPLYCRPFMLFAYRYVVRLGFLDGKEGLLYHFTQAFLYRLLVDAAIDELRMAALSTVTPATTVAPD